MTENSTTNSAAASGAATQPEALRLAEWLDGTRGWPSDVPQEAAAELRRLYARMEAEVADHLQTIGERDHAEQLGTKLANAVSEHFRVPVGEYSNINDPRLVALDILGGGYITDSDADRAARLAAPAAQEAEPAAAPGFPPRILALLREVASRNPPPGCDVWEDDRGKPLQDDADAALAWIAARPQADAGAPPAVPEGWRLVPVEPTAKMSKAAADAWLDCGSRLCLNKATAAARAAITAAPQAPAAPMSTQPAHHDSTPGLRVGDSSFDHWFQQQPFATQTGVKQIARDAYAAGMGDPLVVPAVAPAAGAAPTQHITEPYTVAEIRERVASGDYSAELMLQHAMLHLGAVAGAAPTDAEIGQLFADETGFLMEQQPAAIASFARAVLARWGAAAPAQEAEDAARYRWLRDETEWEPFDSAWLHKMDIYGCPSRVMDAAIDAARARHEGGA